MSLPANGVITFSDISVELGNAATASVNLNAPDVRTLFGIPTGDIRMSDGYGKTNMWTFVNSSSVRGSNTVTIPSGYAANDLMVLVISTGSGSITKPTGWDEISLETFNFKAAIYSKKSANSESNFTFADSGQTATSISLLVYRKVDNVSWQKGTVTNNTNKTYANTTSLTTDTNNECTLRVYCSAALGVNGQANWSGQSGNTRINLAATELLNGILITDEAHQAGAIGDASVTLSHATDSSSKAISFNKT